MPLNTESFVAQNARWPQSGRVILAQSDADSVIVYQHTDHQLDTLQRRMAILVVISACHA